MALGQYCTRCRGNGSVAMDEGSVADDNAVDEADVTDVGIDRDDVDVS